MIEKGLGENSFDIGISDDFSLPTNRGAIEYDKHSSIKCNELSHSCVHSCSLTRQKRDFIFYVDEGRLDSREESLNLSTFLSHQHVD